MDCSEVFPKARHDAWLKVIDTVAFGLKLSGKPRDERNAMATNI
jgi:ABC-type taurine transport system ATPase subunit